MHVGGCPRERPANRADEVSAARCRLGTRPRGTGTTRDAAYRSAVRNTSQRATPLTRSPLQGSSSRRYCAGSLCIDRKARTERRRPTRRGTVPRRSPGTPLPTRSVCLGHGRRRWICRLRTVASGGRKPEMPASACRRLPSEGARRQRPRAGPVLPCAPRDQEPAGSTGCSCRTALRYGDRPHELGDDVGVQHDRSGTARRAFAHSDEYAARGPSVRAGRSRSTPLAFRSGPGALGPDRWSRRAARLHR